MKSKQTGVTFPASVIKDNHTSGAEKLAIKLKVTKMLFQSALMCVNDYILLK